MRSRIGEKIGWLGGWIGGFLWVAILSVVFAFKNSMLQALCGGVLFVSAVLLLLFFAPWRFPQTPYWRLLILPYTLLVLSILWAFWAFDAFSYASVWSVGWFFPLLIPFGTAGRKRWDDVKKDDEDQA